jgi:hypothetical protein
VDIDSAGNLKKFQELYEKYQKQLEKSPAAWAAMTKGQRESLKAVQGISAAMLAQNDILHDADEAERKRLGQLQRTSGLWTGMAKDAKSFASSVISAGASILKWGGLLATGLLGGSLFGLTRMASDVSDQRRSSKGLGMSIGEQKAFQTNFSRVVDPDSFLSWVNQVETDPSKAWSAAALGVGLTGNTESDAVRLLNAIRGKAQGTPTAQLGMLLQRFGLGGNTTEDLRRLQTTGTPEWNSLLSGNRKDIAGLNISDKTALAWQKFTTQMSRAGSEIFKTFVEGLAPLEGPLEHLSQGVVKFVDTLAKSDLVKEGIENLSHWLDNFSGKLSGPEFLKSIDSFMSDVGDLAKAIHFAIHPIDNSANAVGGWASDFKNWLSPSSASVTASKDSFKTYLGRLDSRFGLPNKTLETISQLEASGNLYPKDSLAGAVGAMQIMPSTAALPRYHTSKSDLYDPTKSANLAGQIMIDNLAHYHGDILKALAAYNWKMSELDKDVRAHPRDWLNYAPSETQKYVTKGAGMLGITITNATGGSAQVSVNQLPQ